LNYADLCYIRYVAHQSPCSLLHPPDPLTFTVTDLHFISQQPSSQQNFESDYHNTNNIFQYDQQHVDPLYQKGKNNNKSKNNNNSAGLPIMPSFQDSRVQPAIRDSVSQFGLDALVMLMGEEIEMDDECNELMANLVWKDGIPGGADPSAAANAVDASDGADIDDAPQEDQDFDDENSKTAHHGEMERPLDLKDGDWAELMDWLDEDDEEEEEEIGTSVVIGRTHLFTGEKRKYPGMPASSTAEELYKAFSTGAISSSQESWEDSDFRLKA